MKMSFETYRDKVMGCWVGKNAGGVLGAPFEQKRQINDVDFYTQDLSAGPPPNDDFDLQIIWLTAVERFGRSITASILGEYWFAYITPNWVEYGTGKANMRAGLEPPVSGHYYNQYRNSCGCFIRAELWACLAPGHPEIATRYAYEDAIVDHSGEGMYGEIFCAALQSAAFVESDTRKLIDIGLSYIPENCAVARCVNRAMECYDKQVPFLDARLAIHNEAPGMFAAFCTKDSKIPTEGGKFEKGTPGFDCPENVGFLIAAWLYGEGDFGRSLCLAVNCGEDTDCTAGTLGGIMGIIAGGNALPEKWTAPLNDRVETLCIDKTSQVWIPKTTTEMTDKLVQVTPTFLGTKLCDVMQGTGYTVECLEGEDLYCEVEDYRKHLCTGIYPRDIPFKDLMQLSPYTVKHVFPMYKVWIEYGEQGPFFEADKPKRVTIKVLNSDIFWQQHWCKLKLYLPEGVEVLGGNEFDLPLNDNFGEIAVADFDLDTSAFKGGRLEAVVDVSLIGRHTATPVKLTLLRSSALDKGEEVSL